MSDHFVVDFDLKIDKPSKVRREISHRDIKSLDICAFNQSLNNVTFKEIENASERVQDYDGNLQSVFNEHAPLVVKSVIVRPNTKWYTQFLRQQKIIRRRKERKWQSGLDKDEADYRKQCDYVNFLMNEGKSELYSNQIIESSQDKKLSYE